ncbi:hypothetical protein E2C01_034788 [Portunus trituberculatus]|uniref:Endonuclease/exonuclease/phosphatase domain-containing protein n=1 Tax=Portunus trituberculatus TaxID=210409 RepID=A0A5B7F2F6_PORTR|nr:hypothetical protein [Portunus trituberculatus]
MGVIIKTEEIKKTRIITNTWRTEEHKEMQGEVIKCLDNMIRRDGKILLVGHYTCQKSKMERDGNAGWWSKQMLQLNPVNTLDQWVEESTRYTGEEEPSLLDIYSIHKEAGGPLLSYNISPMGRSDHVTLELEMQEEGCV